jgi:GNAT superfamily N-acetyltransferase
MPIDIVRVDYSNPEHGSDLLAMLEIYASDPMGGSGTLSDHVKTHLLPDMAALPFAFSLLAYRDDQPVGLTNCFFGYSTFSAQPLINIHDMVTHPDHRRSGVATAMFAEIERLASARGCCKITLEVLSGNIPAKALYARLGYSGYGLGVDQGTAEFWQKALI